MKKLNIAILFFLFSSFLFSCKTLKAFELITAKEAYDMVAIGEAKLIDVRTLEEYVFVGSPAFEPGGDPIAFLLPWESLEGVDENGGLLYRENPDFDELLNKTFGEDKDQSLIIICRSGNRSTYATLRLEDIGYTHVYEVDNELKELNSESGGRGGVQGTSYKNSFNGYRGFPGRLPAINGGVLVHIATDTNSIQDENDSVAWMDLGLPVTQKIDSSKYLRKYKRISNSTISSQPIDNYSFQNNNNSLINNYTQPFFRLLNSTLNTTHVPPYNNIFQNNSIFSPTISTSWNFTDPFASSSSSCSGDLQSSSTPSVSMDLQSSYMPSMEYLQSLYSPSMDLQSLYTPEFLALKSNPITPRKT